MMTALHGLAHPRVVVFEAFAEGLQFELVRSVSEWADEHRILSKSSSAEWGKWKTSKTPYLREIMDALSPGSPHSTVVFQKPTQIGGTETGNNFIGHIIHEGLGPTMIVLPTSNAAKKASKTRISPMITDTPVLRDRVKDARSRDSGNTTLLKEFEGGVLIFAGANSATELKSSPVRNLMLDETEEYPADVDSQGDPRELAVKRTDTFGRRKKIYETSTPTIMGGRIDAAYKASDQRLYFVPCPICGRTQTLRFDRLRWETRKVFETVADSATGEIKECAPDAPGAVERDTGELIDVYYQCESCDGRIDEHAKTEMLARGVWIAQNPGPDRAAGFKLNALYSPVGWFVWRDVVLAYLKAQRDTSGTLMKVFTNTVLAEAYEQQGEAIESHVLKLRIEARRMCSEGGVVPRFLLMLTAGVDVQHNRLECRVWGWGRDLESGLVDRVIIYGSPALQETWDALEDVLRKGYPHAGGSTLRIAAMAIDAGDGVTTHFVRVFVRKWADTKRVIAVKGQAVAGKPLIGKPALQDVNFRGEILKKSVMIWQYGADTAKGALYARMKVDGSDPAHGVPMQADGKTLDVPAIERGGIAGFVHLPGGLPDEEFEQMTAEKRITRYLRGQPRTEWQLPAGKKNEALDCAGMAHAAAEYAGLSRVNWDSLERLVITNQSDLFAGKSAQPAVKSDGGAAASAAAASQAAAPAIPASTQSQRPHRRIRRPGNR